MINLKKIKLQWTPEELNDILECADNWERAEHDDMKMERRAYLGSCLLLTPSGKFYMPFACSNVIGDCETCNGTGTLYKGRRRNNKHTRAQVQKLPGKVGRKVARAQARNTRLFRKWMLLRKLRTRVRPETIEALKAKRKDRDINARFYAEQKYECPDCNGHGSNSAAADEIWFELLEKALDEIGAYQCDDPGDGCSICIGQSRDIEYGDDIECERAGCYGTAEYCEHNKINLCEECLAMGYGEIDDEDEDSYNDDYTHEDEGEYA